jgi:aerobic carbon-monoxide dehydrogenase large subunit
MGEFAIGQSVVRREDPRLLRGNGRYFDDLKLADQVFAAIVRSPHAHADIRRIDAAEALKMQGVHVVLTGEDYRADGLGSLPSLAPYKKRDGSPMYLPPRPAIAIGRAMHVGYPVAVVVADTLDIARDAAERVAVDYVPRPAVYRRAMRSRRMRRNSMTIVRATRPISTRLATRPRSMRRS